MEVLFSIHHYHRYYFDCRRRCRHPGRGVLHGMYTVVVWVGIVSVMVVGAGGGR